VAGQDDARGAEVIALLLKCHAFSEDTLHVYLIPHLDVLSYVICISQHPLHLPVDEQHSNGQILSSSLVHIVADTVEQRSSEVLHGLGQDGPSLASAPARCSISMQTPRCTSWRASKNTVPASSILSS
jgi:hypothetical protein